MTLFTDHCHGRPLLVTQSWKIAGSGRLNVQKATKNPQSGLAASRGDNSGMQFRERSRRHLVVKCPPPGNRSHPLPLVVGQQEILVSRCSGSEDVNTRVVAATSPRTPDGTRRDQGEELVVNVRSDRRPNTAGYYL